MVTRSLDPAVNGSPHSGTTRQNRGDRNVATEETPTEGGGLGRHFKRYGVFYAIAVIIAVVAVVLPNRNKDDDTAKDTGDAVAAGDGDSSGAWAPASGGIKVGTGTTRGGVECKDGVKQVADT